MTTRTTTTTTSSPRRKLNGERITQADRQRVNRILANFHADAYQKRARIKRAIQEGDSATIDSWSRTLAVDLLQIQLLEDLIEELHIEAQAQAEAADALALPPMTDEELDRWEEQQVNAEAARRGPDR